MTAFFVWAPAVGTTAVPQLVSLASSIPQHCLTKSSDPCYDIRAFQQKKVSFSDTGNFYRFHDDEHPSILKHGVISGITSDTSVQHFTKNFYRQALRVWKFCSPPYSCRRQHTKILDSASGRTDVLWHMADTLVSRNSGTPGVPFTSWTAYK